MAKRKAKLEGVVTELPESTETIESSTLGEQEQEIAEKAGEKIINDEPIVTEAKVKQKFLMVGMTDYSQKVVDFVKSIDDYTPIEMTLDEMNFVVNARAKVEREKSAEGILNDPENKIRAAELATEFVKQFEKEFNHDFVAKAYIKTKTKYSWSQFDRVIGTLDMFGHVHWRDEKRMFLKIIVTKEFMIANRKAGIRRTMDLLRGQILEMETEYPEDIDLKETKKVKTALKLK